MVRVTIVRQYGNNITQNFRFWVRNVQAPPEVNNSIKMEVGIEDCLHIEFEYAKSKYSLKARAHAHSCVGFGRMHVCESVFVPANGTR